MILNKTLTRSFMSCVLGMGLVLTVVRTANAEKVQSDSKYDIDIAVFQGTCDPNKGPVDSFASSMAASVSDKKSKFTDKFKNAIDSAFNSQAGCTESGIYVLKSKSSMTVSAGQWIIASKENGNPWPAICQIPKGKTVTLKTIKSEKLRKMFGFSGDAGLTCDIN